MSNNTKLETIKKLHKLDCKLINLQKKHEELPKSLRQLDQAVQDKDDALREAESQLKALRTRYDSKDLELKSHEEEIKRFEGQLKSVKTNKEYSAILSEVATKKADVAKTEEEMLTIMDSIEQQEQVVAECKDNKRLAEKDREDHKDEIADQQQEVDERLEELRAKRQKLLEEEGGDFLHLYERILEKRGLTAVVPVIDHTCQGCFMKMTPEVQAQLVRNTDIIHCKFCSRIIYLEE